MSLAFDETVAALRVRIDAHERYSTLKLEDVLSARLASSVADRVLDIGCGSGNFATLLAGHAKALYVGMDKSAELLHAAATTLQRAETRHAVLVRADMDRPLPFDAGRFDVIVFAYSAYYTDSAERLLGEVIRVLAPAGRLLMLGPAGGHAEELDLIGEKVFGVPAAPAKTLRARRLQDEFVPLLRRSWHTVSDELLDCSLVFPDVESYAAYYQATPQFLELAPRSGTGLGPRVDHAIRSLSALRVTKQVLVVTASVPPR